METRKWDIWNSLGHLIFGSTNFIICAGGCKILPILIENLLDKYYFIINIEFSSWHGYIYTYWASDTNYIQIFMLLMFVYNKKYLSICSKKKKKIHHSFSICVSKHLAREKCHQLLRFCCEIMPPTSTDAFFSKGGSFSSKKKKMQPLWQAHSRPFKLEKKNNTKFLIFIYIIQNLFKERRQILL